MENNITNVLDQGLYKLLCTSACEYQDTCKMPSVAPTGKAAYNVKGSTINAAFNIPANKKLQYTPLEP